MKKAHTVPDILAVTKNLSDVREEIEEADTEFRHLRDQVEMAKLDINLSSQTASTVRWSPGSSTKSAFTDFLAGLATIADFIIWVVVNIPVIALWVIIIFFLLAAIWYVLRKSAQIMRRMFGGKSRPADGSLKP
jgi:Flp pilus assembly protein TadB